MNLPSPPAREFGLRERLRSAESRLRAADGLAAAARACLTSPGWESLYELESALDRYEHPPLLGSPGRLLTDHRLTSSPARHSERTEFEPSPRVSREVVHAVLVGLGEDA